MTGEINLVDISEAVMKVERCMGPVRFVPLSGMQAHRKKLQQLYEVTEYRDGAPWARTEEWRDVPE